MKTLSELLKQRSFPEFAQWWPMGTEFITFMAKAILSAWTGLGEIKDVQAHIAEYTRLVYGRKVDPELAAHFVVTDLEQRFYSGEFDALSYAFFRTAFEAIHRAHPNDDGATTIEKRAFTRRVGSAFYNQVHEHLGLDLPPALNTPAQFAQLQEQLEILSSFLLIQGYLRNQCVFSFAVSTTHQGELIQQSQSDFLRNLDQNGLGYALYIMGYPAILPSAILLYGIFGEAQHHSSRTIEELFARAGLTASETQDFDPSGYPADRVVELWEIRQ